MSDTTRRGFFGTLAALVAGAVAAVSLKAPMPIFDQHGDGNAFFAVGTDGVFRSTDGVNWTNLSESHIREQYIVPAFEQISKEQDAMLVKWISVIR